MEALTKAFWDTHHAKTKVIGEDLDIGQQEKEKWILITTDGKA